VFPYDGKSIILRIFMGLSSLLHYFLQKARCFHRQDWKEVRTGRSIAIREVSEELGELLNLLQQFIGRQLFPFGKVFQIKAIREPGQRYKFLSTVE